MITQVYEIKESWTISKTLRYVIAFYKRNNKMVITNKIQFFVSNNDSRITVHSSESLVFQFENI